MTGVRDWLRENDPVANEPPLSEVDVRRMRRAIAAAGESRQPSFGDWARGTWATATVVVALTTAIGIGRWATPAGDVRRVNADAAPAVTVREPGARRQVQLIAPGGTRVIWIFNADFEMKEKK
jgi:hypothetical protein